MWCPSRLGVPFTGGSDQKCRPNNSDPKKAESYGEAYSKAYLRAEESDTLEFRTDQNDGDKGMPWA